MYGLSTLLERPRRRRGIFFAAGITLLSAVAMLSPAIRADAAAQPSVGVFWSPTPQADAGQCGNPSVPSQWAVSPDWTFPIRIDTDNRAGGCELSFGIFDPSSLLTGLGVTYSWFASPNGNAGQCQNPGQGFNQGTYSMPVNTQFQQFGPVILDDTDNRAGYCNLTFTMSGNANTVLDVQYYADSDGDPRQCVGAMPQGSFATAAVGSPVTIGLDTDNALGGCWLSLRLRHFSSAAAAHHAAGIHRL